jgi:hypothetical protein
VGLGKLDQVVIRAVVLVGLVRIEDNPSVHQLVGRAGMSQAHIRGELVSGSVNSATLEYAEPDDYGDGDKDAQDGDGRHQLRQREASLVLPKTVWPLPQNTQDPILPVCSSESSSNSRMAENVCQDALGLRSYLRSINSMR